MSRFEKVKHLIFCNSHEYFSKMGLSETLVTENRTRVAWSRDKVRQSPGLYNSNPWCYETPENYWHEQRLVAPSRPALTTQQQN